MLNVSFWWRYSLKILSTYPFILFESSRDGRQLLRLKWLSLSFQMRRVFFLFSASFFLFFHIYRCARALWAAINNCPHRTMKCLWAWRCTGLLQNKTPGHPSAERHAGLKPCCFSTRGQHACWNPQTPLMSYILHTPVVVNPINIPNTMPSTVIFLNSVSSKTRKLKLCFTSDIPVRNIKTAHCIFFFFQKKL